MKIHFVALIAALPFNVFSQNFLDPGFANAGVFIHSLSGQSVEAFDDLVATEDGGVMAVAAGTVFKLDHSGAPDASFGTNGIALISMAAATLAVDPEGSIYLAGSSYIDFMNTPSIVKLTASGAFDPTFGDEGMVLFTELADGRFTEIGIRQGGGIRVGGYFFLNNDTSPILAQVDESGSLVPGFGSNGITTLEHLPSNSHIVDLTMLPNERTLVSCRTPDGFLVTLLDGSAEPMVSFGNGGILAFEEDADLTGCTLDQTGMVLMGITTTFPWDNTIQCRRIDQDGNLDQTFGVNGTATIDTGPTIRAGNARPCPAEDGRILLVGTGLRIVGLMTSHPFFCGLNADGTVNTSVGIDGVMLDTLNTCQGSGAVFTYSPERIYCWGGTSPGIDADLIITCYQATPVSISEYPSASNCSIWPQPVVDFLNITHCGTPSVQRFDVLDGLGKPVLGFFGTRSPDLSSLLPGPYILVDTGSGHGQRFLKQ